jgi:predicted nucleic acid-binding protein
MESALLGLVLDSSTVIRAERSKQSIPDFIEAIFRAHGSLDLSLSPVTVAELVHGIYRAKSVGNRPEPGANTSKNSSTWFLSIQ